MWQNLADSAFPAAIRTSITRGSMAIRQRGFIKHSIIRSLDVPQVLKAILESDASKSESYHTLPQFAVI